MVHDTLHDSVDIKRRPCAGSHPHRPLVSPRSYLRWSSPWWMRASTLSISRKKSHTFPWSNGTRIRSSWGMQRSSISSQPPFYHWNNRPRHHHASRGHFQSPWCVTVLHMTLRVVDQQPTTLNSATFNARTNMPTCSVWVHTILVCMLTT